MLVNGHKLLATTNNVGSKTLQAWKTFMLTVNAIKPETTIESLNGDSGSENGLDAVSPIKH